MGLDFISITVPLDAAPMRMIRTDPGLWELADTHPPFAFADPDYDVPLPKVSRQLLAVLPPGSGWISHFNGRAFEQAEYLLDPAAYRAPRTWEERERSMVYRIILGDELFAEHAQSGQGPHWRCSTAAFLTAAVQYIDDLEVDAIRSEFSVAEMARLGVYKVHPEDDDDEAFARVLGYVREFADYCRSAPGRGLDLIITLF
ncbi:DUF1877 family protein [Actinoplanes sp. NPDC051513]|uniref:DUF1877 family protein n=1 Tax=Actinoplanes sp. NPDC051513 TaxID=3363908 RepID=UPI0037A2EC3F